MFATILVTGCKHQNSNQTQKSQSLSTTLSANDINTSTSNNQQTNNNTNNSSLSEKADFDKKTLETVVYNKIDHETKGKWDKKIKTNALHTSLKAAKGT